MIIPTTAGVELENNDVESKAKNPSL